MPNVPSDLKYTADNEWIRIESDGTWTVGLTEYAIDGDILSVQLPEVGATREDGDAVGLAEGGAVFGNASAKLIAPVGGEITEVNRDTEAGIEGDHYKTWLFKVRPVPGASADALMDAASYSKMIDDRAAS
jgi:glycine cleavage system H protein